MNFPSTSELCARSGETSNPQQLQWYHVQHTICLGVGGRKEVIKWSALSGSQSQRKQKGLFFCQVHKCTF